jgi:hypothetical protein
MVGADLLPQRRYCRARQACTIEAEAVSVCGAQAQARSGVDVGQFEARGRGVDGLACVPRIGDIRADAADAGPSCP